MNPRGVSGAWFAAFLSRPVSKGLVFAFKVLKVYPRRASTRTAPGRYAGMETRLTLRPGESGTRKLAKLKALGALRRPRHKLWDLPWSVVRSLALEDRVVRPQLI